MTSIEKNWHYSSTYSIIIINLHNSIAACKKVTRCFTVCKNVSLVMVILLMMHSYLHRHIMNHEADVSVTENKSQNALKQNLLFLSCLSQRIMTGIIIVFYISVDKWRESITLSPDRSLTFYQRGNQSVGVGPLSFVR